MMFPSRFAASAVSMNMRPVLRGVVFDMDGTLTVPNLDFVEMYRRCGVPQSDDLLAAVAKMPADSKESAHAVIAEMEAEGRRTLCLMPGAVDCIRWLHRHRVPMAMVTRNTKETVEHFHAALLKPAGLSAFDLAISRDDDFEPKPHPAAFEEVAKQWGAPLGPELVMVGDSPSNDIKFGKAAGASTVLLDTGRRHVEGGTTGDADVCVENLALLPHQLWQRFQIESPNGTAIPLQKFETPLPGSPVCEAAARGDTEFLSATPLHLLETPDASSNTPLIFAADAGQSEVVKLLLEKGVEVNAKGFLGSTAVCRACRRGHADVLNALLRHATSAVDLDEPNDKLQHPLHFAAFKKHPALVRLMLEHGASTTVCDRKGRTPAEDTSDEDIRRMILEVRARQLSAL